MMQMTPIQIQARARLELHRRAAPVLSHLSPGDPAAFIARTKIEVPVSEIERTLIPFEPWPAQRDVLAQMVKERLIVFLKARQLGISWIVCGFVLDACMTTPGQPWLMLSQGQLEANELTHRVSLMYHEHQDRAQLPRLIKDNAGELLWGNRSRVLSLPATRRVGRSFTAAGVVLDEWAFMQWPRETLAAVKPTIDAGGKLFIISSADGLGTAYHQHYNAAKSGANGYTAIFLPWTARPDRGPGWRDQKLIEAAGDEVAVRREYPENDIEAFAAATGLVYDVWSDGPPDGNVTEAADYIPDGGSVLWGADDGYAGQRDPASGFFTADSHPRVFGLYQLRHNGDLCRFDESYAVKTLTERQIADVRALPYPDPDYAVVDSSAAELRGRLQEADIPAFGGTHRVEEGIKVMQRFLAKDANGRRRFLVHPRCRHFRAEMASYRYDPQTGKPIKQYDHGPDEARMMCWKQRNE